MALVGNLRDLKLTNIVQLNCMEKNEAMFTVELRNAVGKIYFADGNIVHATFGNVEGEDAVYKILAIKEGPFKVENGVASPKRTINAPWGNLMMEGLRLIDEALEAKGEAMAKFTRDIKTINGVNAVLVSSPQGEILMEDGIANGKRTSAGMGFIMRKLAKIGRASKSGTYKFGIVTGKNDRKIISKWHDDIITLTVEQKAAADLIEQAIDKAPGIQKVSE